MSVIPTIFPTTIFPHHYYLSCKGDFICIGLDICFPEKHTYRVDGDSYVLVGATTDQAGFERKHFDAHKADELQTVAEDKDFHAVIEF